MAAARKIILYNSSLMEHTLEANVLGSANQSGVSLTDRTTIDGEETCDHIFLSPWSIGTLLYFLKEHGWSLEPHDYRRPEYLIPLARQEKSS